MKATANAAPLGYTLIELLVVMACVGLLLAIAGPRYSGYVDKARDTALRHNLMTTRDAIDKFYADKLRYPKDLKELVTEKYLRGLPVDPVTDRDDTWQLVAPNGQKDGAVVDVRSGAPGKAADGSVYASW